MKKRITSIFALMLAAALLLSACGKDDGNAQTDKNGSGTQNEQQKSAEPGTLTQVYTPEYAKGFTIEYYEGGAKIIATNIKATTETPAMAQRVLLLPEGAAQPKDAKWDAQIDGAVTSVVTLASSHAGHFANLDSVDVLKGVSIKPESCFVPSLKTALEGGTTQYVGSSSDADTELIASLKPQVVFVGGMASNIEVAQKLEESKIFCLYFGDFAEEDYMGRAQWIELMGAMIGKEEQAKSFMQDQKTQVEEVLNKVKEQTAKPKVLWYTYSSSEPHWNVKTENDYVASLVEAAGGQLIHPEGIDSNSVKLSNEDFLQYMNDAERIIFGVSLNSYKDAADMSFFNQEGQIDFTTAPAFQNKGCYVVGFDWAQDTANAAEIIRSMAACLYPDAFSDTPADSREKIILFEK